MLSAIIAAVAVAAAPQPSIAVGKYGQTPASTTDAIWLQVPSDAQVEAAWPGIAKRLHVSGAATLDCAVGEDGKLTQCTVFAETPAGSGFGAAATVLATGYVAQPGLVKPGPIRPRVNIPIIFQFPGSNYTGAQTIRDRITAVMNPPGASMPRDQEALNLLLQKEDYHALGRKLALVNDGNQVGLDMNWERSKHADGAGLAVALLYVTDLWRLGSAIPGATGDSLKQTAAAFGLYAYELIAIDGTRCEDSSAPSHHLDQLVFSRHTLWVYALSLPESDRAKLWNLALTIEQGTQSVRREDKYLCSGGLDEMNASFAALGNKPLTLAPIPPSPGQLLGHQYVVTPPANFQPGFLKPELWRAKQDELRKQMPTILKRLLTAPPAPPTLIAPNGK